MLLLMGIRKAFLTTSSASSCGLCLSNWSGQDWKARKPNFKLLKTLLSRKRRTESICIIFHSIARLLEQHPREPFLVLHHSNESSGLWMPILILALLVFTLPTTVLNAAGKFCFLVMVQTSSSIDDTKKNGSWILQYLAWEDFTVLTLH